MAHHLVVSLAQVVDVNRVSTRHARRRLRLLPRLVRVRLRLRVRARLRGQAQGLGVRVRVRCACCQCSDAKRHRAKIEGASSGASGASGSGRSSLGLGLGLGLVLGLGLGSANPNLAELGQESAQHRSLGGEQRAEPPRLVRGAWCVVRSGRRAVRVGSERRVVRGG